MENIVNTLKQTRKNIKNWWVVSIMGLLSIAMGFVVMFNPESSYAALGIVFISAMIATGALSLYYSFTNRKYLEGWGWLFASGILEISAGVYLASNFGTSLIALPIFVGFYLFFTSVFLVMQSFELKSYGIMDWGYYLLAGFMLSAFSVLMIAYPAFGGASMVAWTAASFIVAGTTQFVLSVRLQKLNKGINEVEQGLESQLQAS